jgi:hypothetical protein
MFFKQSTPYLFLAVFTVLGFLPVSAVFAITSYQVSTISATDICQTGGVLRGYINPFFTNDTVRWFEWGTSHDFLPNRTNTTINGNNTESFSQTIRGLATQTTYYFRVAAQNSLNPTPARGEIMSFKTRGNICGASIANAPNTNTPDTNSNTNNVLVFQTVITGRATGITDTGATLNATALSAGGSAITYGWFEWGSTPNLGYTTIRRNVGTGASSPFDEDLSGLTPGTTYFFKPIIENQNRTAEGTTFSFHTTGMTPIGTSVSGTPNTASAATSILPTTKKITKPAVVAVPDPGKAIKVEVIPTGDTAAAKERIRETVQLENMTNSTLKEVVVRLVLSCNVNYIPTGGDEFVQNGTMLTHKIGDMKPKEKISLILWVETLPGLADKTPIETIAVVDWKDKTSPNGAESVGRATITIDKNKTAKESVAAAGAVKDANSLFPKNLKDWGAIIGFMFLLFAAYMVFLLMREKKEEESFAEAVSFENTETPVHPTLTRADTPYRNYIKDPFISDNNLQKNTIIAPNTPIKNPITEKGSPPENLPI